MKFILLLSALSMTLLNAVVIDQSKLQELSSHPTWLKLLHFKSNKSTMIDNNFFLADNGNISAKKELEKTLEAYSKPFNTLEEHARCRYPARYYWLSKYLELKDYTPVNSKCTKLKKWKLLDNTTSISVVFVSGYLGNPASAFGHSFIKINKSNNFNNNLFDTSISYGALLPKDYNIPQYIYNGITGGYSAAYSDKYYYNQDITYSNEEHRDMWEYRLKLTEDKKKLFLLHAWELMGKKFQYFFLNRNCGYKVSEFLELVYDEKIIQNASLWYAPIETFYKLKELDNHQEFISEVNYIASKQQQLYAHYDGLNTNEKNIVLKMIENNLNDIPLSLLNSHSSEQSNALDFILAYRKYSFPKASNQALLFSRLKLPVRTKEINKPKAKIDISEYNSPSTMGLSMAKESINFIWSPFSLEQNGYNDLDGDELVVFDTKFNINNKRTKLSKFDLIRIQKLKTKQLPFERENPLSWSLHIGTQSIEKRDYFANAGLGFASQINTNTKVYAITELSLHSTSARYRIMPKLGIFNNFNKLRISSSIAYEKDVEHGRSEKVINMKGQYKFNEKISFFVDYDLNKYENFELGIKWIY